jgi:hypothetical protein
MSVKYMKVDTPTILSLPKPSDVGSAHISPRPQDNPDALFEEEISDLLSGLEAAIPGLGMVIACLLTRMAIKGKSKKVGDSLGLASRRRSYSGCKDNKSGAT